MAVESRPRGESGSPGYIAMFTDATDVGDSVLFQSGGFVGFGTTNPTHGLHVFNDSAIFDSNLNGQLYVQNTYASNSQGHASLVLDKGSSSASAALAFNSAGVQQWDVGASDDNNFHVRSLVPGGTNTKPFTIEHTAPASSLYITAAGNVGLGTSTPVTKLEVGGAVQVDGALKVSSGGIVFPDGSTQNTAVVTPAGNQSTALGTSVLVANTGQSNVGLGDFALTTNSSGSFNTAIGFDALLSNTLGQYNTAVGYQALFSNVGTGAGSGYNNTAIGAAALYANNTGQQNTAVGTQSLNANTAGSENTAVGFQALHSNTVGQSNTAVGYQALFINVGNSSNGSGYYSTAVGVSALYANSTGQGNTALGYNALLNNQSGDSNVAVGPVCLNDNLSGNNNTAVGFGALYAAAGNNNIGIGNEAGLNPTGDDNIMIGNQGTVSDEGVIRIGTPGDQNSTFIAGITGVGVSGVQVLVSSSGQLGIAQSSRRYKEDIRDMEDSSTGLMRLRPVTFRYRKPFDDGSQPIQYGLVAEEVEEVYPELVARSADGRIESVRYQMLDSMLLNEVQKQRATIAAQQEEIRLEREHTRQLEERLARLEAALERYGR